jgi:hypothetical protein
MMNSFNLIIEFLDRQVKDKPDLRTGTEELDNFLRNHFQISILDKIDLDRLDIEFKEKVKDALTTDKVSNDIRSIYFGLLTIAGDTDDTSLTTVHVAGSKSTPEKDLEWACDIAYKSSCYINLKDFALIDSSLGGELEDKGIIEVVVFNGLLNLLLINSLDLVKGLAFHGSSRTDRQSLWLGTGFDSGDCYVLGEVSA